VRRRALLLAMLTLSIAACAYYNGLYNANRLANDARRAEREGRTSEARSLWSRAAVKAETVIARFPKSKYHDDALLLHGLALARLNSCGQALSSLREATTSSRDERVRADAHLLAARCWLALEQPESVLTEVATLADGARREGRDEALLLRGQAYVWLGRDAPALADLEASAAPAAAYPRAIALVRLGRSVAAESVLTRAALDSYDEQSWLPALDSVGRRSPAAAAALVDRLVTRPDLTPGEQRRLLLRDGERWLNAGEDTLAARRFSAIAAVAPDSSEGGTARAHLAVQRLRQTHSLAELPARLDSLASASRRGGPAVQVVAPYVAVLTRTVDALDPDAMPLALFLAGEYLRDSLGMRDVAAEAFAEVVRRAPESVIAPKALLAQAVLEPGSSDSLVALVRERYPESVYTLALVGSAGDAYRVLEDSLQRVIRELQQQRRRPNAARDARIRN
jgi:predicted negative regulator of RcsB-dependent stress response